MAALARYRVIDTTPEPMFDYLVHAASSALRAPFAQISLLDGAQHWAKASIGLSPTHRPRGSTFGDVVIRSDEMVIVPDARAHPVYREFGIVTGARAVRFYAGAPLITADGYRIGAFSVLDTAVREDFSHGDQQTLRALAAAAVAALELRTEMLERQEVERRLKAQCGLMDMAEAMANVGHWREDFVSGQKEQSLQLQAIYGSTGPSVEPEDYLSRYVEEDRERVAEAVRQARSANRPLSYEARLVRDCDGEVRHVLSRSEIQSDDNGAVIGRFGVLQDVTEHKLALQAAHQASKAKADFLANISHEIRTPLTSIIGFAGLLRGVADLDDAPRMYAERIHTAGEGLLALINDVLDFSRLEARHIRLEASSISFGAVVRGAVETISVMAHAKGLELKVVDSLHGHDQVIGDAARLRQVMLNLLSNAVKFTDAGSVTVQVSRDDGGVRVSVQDTGCGIPESQQQRLFQRFVQADETTARRFGGSGLGLAICSQLVELMGGEIGFSSRAGEGSTFWAVMPLAECGTTDEVFGDAVQATRPFGGRVLVVDDVDFNRELVRLLLEPMGSEVTEAASGFQALEACAIQAFDLIIMDVNMPGMDGMEAANRLRRGCPNNRNTPIIAFTASAEREKTEHYLGAGMNQCLTKPVRPAEFYACIGQWLTPVIEEAGEAGAA